MLKKLKYPQKRQRQRCGGKYDPQYAPFKCYAPKIPKTEDTDVQPFVPGVLPIDFLSCRSREALLAAVSRGYKIKSPEEHFMQAIFCDTMQ